MKVLFAHPYFPGQFAQLARFMVDSGRFAVKALSSGVRDGRDSAQITGVDVITYGSEVVADRPPQHVLNGTETYIRQAASLALAADQLKASGFYPDVIYIHTGWGAGSFLHNVFPAAKLVKYCEWFYNQPGSGMAFLRPERSIESLIMEDLLNLPILAELSNFDRLIAPTEWQKQQFPAPFRDRIDVVPDGIDADILDSGPRHEFVLGDGRSLSAGQRIITYVARGADTFRGFGSFIKAVELVQAQHEDVHVLIAGDRKSFYGPEHGTEDHFHEVMRDARLDPARTHFLGHVDRARYLALLKVSSVHVYLTVPFVQSWSMLEAMAAGCLVVGSDTAPVREFIAHGENGLLADFFDPKAIAREISSALSSPERMAPLRKKARQTIIDRWSVDEAIERHMDMIAELTGRQPRDWGRSWPDQIPLAYKSR